MTRNIGGWTSHRDDVLASLLHDPPSIVALQELGMSVHAQAAVSRFRMTCFTLQPRPTREQGKVSSGWPKDRSLVLVSCSTSLLASPPFNPPRTDQGATLQHNGRLCMALLQVSKKTCYMLLNVYCPSGWDRERVKEREEVFTTVLTEIQAHADVNMILLGDMNEYFPESLMAGPDDALASLHPT
eukprot:6350082-Amphidinium_carterae.1